jgi:glycosyltransferase involved in cell wall biosynthesis
MNFSLIIPCYNEEANLPLLLERCKVLAAHPGVEIILVDNGSTDNSSNILLDLLPNFSGCRSIRVEKNKGYGFGIISGLKAAESELLGWTHADMQTDPEDVLKGLELFDEYGLDIFVKGKRYGRPLVDVFFTLGMSFFETLLMRKSLWDINAQPTMFSHNFFKTWVAPPDDFALDLYAYFQAQHLGIKIHRFPVKFGERAHGVSHWNVNWQSKWKFISRTINFSFELKKNLLK